MMASRHMAEEATEDSDEITHHPMMKTTTIMEDMVVEMLDTNRIVVESDLMEEVIKVTMITEAKTIIEIKITVVEICLSIMLSHLIETHNKEMMFKWVDL